MKTTFVSIKNAVQDFVQDVGLDHDEIDEKLLIKWAADCIEWINTDQQLYHRIAIILIENSRGLLPADYKILGQAAANPFTWEPCDCDNHPSQDCCKNKKGYNSTWTRTRKETVSQWVQECFNNECKVEVNLVCPKCSKHNCDCGINVIEVDVDTQWKLSHPEIYYKHFARIGRFGYDGRPSSIYSPKFQLMNYATNKFFNASNFITDCPNIDCRECQHEFIIQPPYIEVDFQKGEVLLSYLGVALDDTGEVMIPNNAHVFQAIFHHLRHKWYLRESDRRRDPNLTQVSMLSAQLRDTHIGYAKAELSMPDAHQIKAFLQNSSWLHRVPSWQSDRAGKRGQDPYTNYLER